MGTLQKALSLLESTEHSLAELASEAARAREYQGAETLLDLAQELKGLTGRMRNDLNGRATGSSKGVRVIDEAKISPRPIDAKRRMRGRPAAASYPRFLREGDTLIKIGWSTTENAQYEHKSPASTLWMLVRLFQDTGARRKRFTMDELLPLRNPRNGSEVPMYQAYLCLAWLRSIGLVVQHGRQGYSLGRGQDLLTAAESHWSQLPAR